MTTSKSTEQLRVEAAELEAIAGIPADLMANFAIATSKFRAAGGCSGCGSQVIGACRGDCPTLREPDLY